MNDSSKKITKAKTETPKLATREQLLGERALLRQSLAKAKDAKTRLDLMISSPHAAQLVPTLPAEEVYFTVKEVGLADCLELVQLCGPTQFRALLDLDAWKRGELEASTALTWLRAAGADQDDERFQKKLAKLDMELIELLMRDTLRIWDLEETPDPEPEGATFESPEGHYLVEFRVEGADYIGIRRVLDQLYAEDPFRAARIIEAVRWELPTELEESAYRWRNARLADLGFPEPEEAISYFGYVDPDAPLPALEAVPPVEEGFFLARLAPAERLFDRAVALVPQDELPLLERQLVTLFNAVMVAEGVDPGELEEVERVIRGARDTVSLGLEHASGGDASRAAALLAETPIKRIFQVGTSLALKLKFRADRLMRAGRSSLPGSKDVPLFDSPIGETIVALRRRRPLFSEALLDPERTATRPFRDRSELARAQAALDEAERLAELMTGVGFAPTVAASAVPSGVPAEELSSVRFSDLYLTAVARVAAGESFAFAPLRASRLKQVAEAAFAVSDGEPALRPEFERQLSGPLAQEAAGMSPEHQRAAESFLSRCRERLLDEVGRPWAAEGALDPQMPLPLLVAADE